MSAHDNRTLLIAFAANLGIAVSKFAAAAFTGSSAMLTEGVHSVVDSSNQLLLIWGRRQARKPADDRHPFGYGRELYFWSFVVAVLVFALGAGVSVYEGVIHILEPEPAVSPYIAYGVLLVAFLLENGAAMAGLVAAAIGLMLSQVTGDPFFDGAASVVIGIILGLTAFLLAVESKALLIGEAAEPEIVDGLRSAAARHGGIVGIGRILTVHSAPDQITAMMSVDFDDSITAGEAERIVCEIEAEVARKWPIVRRLYIRPEHGAAE